MKALLLLSLLLGTASAQIEALFKTNVGNFTVELDQHNMPLATANFMLLAGIPDDEWTEIGGTLQTPTQHVQYSPNRPGYLYRKTGRLTLNVLWEGRAGAADPDDPDRYIIRQGPTELAHVSTLKDSQGIFHDLSGKGLVEIHQELGTTNFSIVIKHRRKWLDNRFKILKDAPMYRNMPVTQIDNGNDGRRFFAGTFTNNPAETVGYRFPDEIAPNYPANPPWGNKFSQGGYVLAMDNRQGNSNGSRFFITGLPGDFLLMKEWNKRYTAFGTVLTQNRPSDDPDDAQAISSREVVNLILGSSTDPDGVPGAKITIQTIEISRLSDGDFGFYPHLVQEELPGESTPLSLRIERTDGIVELITPATPGSQQIFITTTGLGPDPTIEEIPFFSSSPPSELEESRLDMTPFFAIQPKSFFRAYWSKIPDWHSKQFSFPGAILRFDNATETGTLSGSVLLTLNVPAEVTENEYFGTFRVILPAKTIEMPNGTTTNFPAFNNQGTFKATYESDSDPYRGRFVINDVPVVTAGAPNYFPFEFFNLNFDFRRGTLLDQRISRFTAGSQTTGYGIDGTWHKTN
ncbi:peptidylprolyl isomerase [Akkermansiaceae bacterium]|nr:peptidylprolyl isomerase [Akkermansiaceae bacterium]